MMDLTFRPDRQRARKLNIRMNSELGASLKHVCDQAQGELSYDRVALQTLVDHLLEGRNVPPATFAHYFELVKAIYAEAREEAERRLKLLAETDLSQRPLEITALGSPQLEDATQIYFEKWSENLGPSLGFREPTGKIAQDFQHRLSEGLDLVREALPELHGEMDAIIHQIVIVGSNPESKYQVDGGSHFQLWGALFLNGHFHPDRIAVAEVLAHESAHSLLFSFCTDEALTNNDEEMTYTSPLRPDPRPMDGIYHATFVSARMHWAMTELAKFGGLTADERTRALKCAEEDRLNFLSGYGVVEQHGNLTETGATLMANARDYIRRSSPLTTE